MKKKTVYWLPKLGILAVLSMLFMVVAAGSSSLIAMLLGRIAGGIASALFYMGNGGSFGIAMWASSYVIGSFPGIICHLILIPLLVLTLTKAKIIPARYPKAV